MALTHIKLLRLVPLLAALAAAAPATGRADTYGLPPFTDFEKEWRLDAAAVKGPDVLVARTPTEWAALWKRLDPRAADAPPVDFGRWMVVGVVTPAGKPGRAVYRVEVGDAADPKELRVRVAADGALCQRPKDMRVQGARVHLAATGVSALPVRFIEDAEVDGGVFGLTEGTDQTPLGTAPGLESPPLKGKAAYREQAERLVRELLTVEEVARLRKGVWPGTFGDRYPQPWSVIQVRRGVDGWAVEYDGLRFTVDAETGKAAAAQPAGDGPAAGTRPAPEKEKPGAGPASYVRVEVKGVLLRKDDGYYVRATDAAFPSTELLVKLERAEDKNRALDEHLKALEGKVVVAEGFLDCRRIGGDRGGVEIHLGDEAQIRPADKE